MRVRADTACGLTFGSYPDLCGAVPGRLRITREPWGLLTGSSIGSLFTVFRRPDAVDAEPFKAAD